MNAHTARTATVFRRRTVRRRTAAFFADAIARPSSRVRRRVCCGSVVAVLMTGGSPPQICARFTFPENWLSPRSQEIPSCRKRSSYSRRRRWRHEHVQPSPAEAAVNRFCKDARARAPPARARVARAACVGSGPRPLVARPQRLGERLLRRRRALHEHELAQLLLRVIRSERCDDGRQAAALALVAGAVGARVRLPL